MVLNSVDVDAGRVRRQRLFPATSGDPGLDYPLPVTRSEMPSTSGPGYAMALVRVKTRQLAICTVETARAHSASTDSPAFPD